MKLTTTLEVGGLSRTSAKKAKRKRGISLFVKEDDDEDKDEADSDTWKNASNKSAKSNIFSDDSYFQDHAATSMEQTITAANGKETSQKSEAVTNDCQQRRRQQQQQPEDEIETKEAKKLKKSVDGDHCNDDNDNNHNEMRKDCWLHQEILVQIISRTLNNGEYYTRKAIVKKVIGKFVAECEVLDGADILLIDQDDLETVIPKMVGEKVRIVNGRYRGMKAMIQKLDKGRYCAELKLSLSSLSGDDIDRDKIVVADYEDFSAIA